MVFVLGLVHHCYGHECLVHGCEVDGHAEGNLVIDVDLNLCLADLVVVNDVGEVHIAYGVGVHQF